MNSKPNEEDDLLDFITNIVIRPTRELYTIDKLGPRHMAVKSNLKALKNIKNVEDIMNNPNSAYDNSQCEMIQVQRKQITIISNNNLIQVSIFQPTIDSKQQDSHKKQIHYESQQFSSISNSEKKKNQGNKKPLQNYCNPHTYNKCVVFLHANSGSRLQCLDYIKYVLQYGSICVAFDYAGSGLSQGAYTSMGVKQSEDLSNVLLQINKLYKIQTYSLWGRSMGAVTCLYFLFGKINQKILYNKICIQSCVIDSPFCNLQKLAIQIASSKTKLPEFVFHPLVNSIQERIKAKIGINIFQKLNLIKKIQNLSAQENFRLKKIRLLFLASRDDKLINYTHSESLYKKLYQNQQQFDNKNSNQSEKQKHFSNIDKQFKHFYQWKKSLNMKGDLIQIGGDHNKPRSNEIKQKCSLFIHAYNDDNNGQNQLNKSMDLQFIKNTGKSIKQKLSFSKRQNEQQNMLKKSQNFASKKVDQNQFALNQKKFQISIDNLHSIQKKKQQEESFINLSFLRNQNLKKRQSLSKKKFQNFKKIKHLQTPLINSFQSTLQNNCYPQASNSISLHTSLSKKHNEEHQKKGLNVVSKQFSSSFVQQDKSNNHKKSDINQNTLKSSQKVQSQKVFSSTATCLSPHVVDNQLYFKKSTNNKESLQNDQTKVSKLAFKQKKISLGNQRKTGLNNTDRISMEQYREGLLSQRMIVNNSSEQRQRQTKNNETNMQYQNFLKLRNQFNQLKSSITLKRQQEMKQSKDPNYMKGFPSMTQASFHAHQQRTQRYYTNNHNESIQSMKTSNLSNLSQTSQSNISNNNSTTSYQQQFQKQPSSLKSQTDNRHHVDISYQNNYVNQSTNKPYFKPQTPNHCNHNGSYQFYYPQQVINRDKPMSQSSTFNYQINQFRLQENNNSLFKKPSQNTSHEYIREVKSQKYPTKIDKQEREKNLNQNIHHLNGYDQTHLYQQNLIQKFVNVDDNKYTLKIKSMRGSQQVPNTYNFKTQLNQNSYEKPNDQFNNFGVNIDRFHNRNENTGQNNFDQNRQVLQYKTKITKLI